MSIDRPIEAEELDAWMNEREYTLSRGFVEAQGIHAFTEFLEMQPISSLRSGIQDAGIYGVYIAYTQTYDKAFRKWAQEQYEEYLEHRYPYEPEEMGI